MDFVSNSLGRTISRGHHSGTLTKISRLLLPTTTGWNWLSGFRGESFGVRLDKRIIASPNPDSWIIFNWPIFDLFAPNRFIGRSGDTLETDQGPPKINHGKQVLHKLRIYWFIELDRHQPLSNHASVVSPSSQLLAEITPLVKGDPIHDIPIEFKRQRWSDWEFVSTLPDTLLEAAFQIPVWRNRIKFW